MFPFQHNNPFLFMPNTTIPYQAHIMYQNMYNQWITQYNMIQSINQKLQVPVSHEGPSQTRQTRKQSLQKSNQLQNRQCKQQQQQLPFQHTSTKILFRNNQQHFQNQEKIMNDQESSFNIKRRKSNKKMRIYKRGPQNKNRNILPSIVQQIFSFLSKQTKSKQISQQIFSFIPHPEEVQVSIQKYYYYIKLIKEKQNHYVNEKTLQILARNQSIGISIFSKSEQIFYLKMARILTKHFLTNILPFLTVHSKRINKDKRIEHLNIRRTLTKIVSQLEC